MSAIYARAGVDVGAADAFVAKIPGVAASRWRTIKTVTATDLRSGGARCGANPTRSVSASALTMRPARGAPIARESAPARPARDTTSSALSGVVAAPRGFAGLFDLAKADAGEGLLAAAADGVGTKILPLFARGLYETAGRDLAAMNVNDVLAQGARPLFFLDYIALGAFDARIAEGVIAGLVEACAEADCVLLGGETALMPGVYPKGEGDLAGFCVGVVEKDARLPCADIAPGDALIAVASSGPHANGFSLIRKLVPDAQAMETQGLLAPTRIYARALEVARKAARVKGVAHITGGGLGGNVPRMWPKRDFGFSMELAPPAPFRFLRARLAEAHPELNAAEIDATMAEVFNCGAGLVIAVAPADADKVVAALAEADEDARVVGAVEREPGARVALRWE